MGLPKVLDFAQNMIQAVLAPGAVAVDATVGNGHDTLFLARAVGPGGHVYGFDVQVDALRAARARLEAAGVMDRVTLFRQGHEAMQAHLPAAVHGHVGAAMFNLGYLPGGAGKTCITRPETTCRALEAAQALLAPGGRLSVVLYAGHPGGAEEAAAVRDWAAALPQGGFEVASYGFINQRNAPPGLLLIEKRPD